MAQEQQDQLASTQANLQDQLGGALGEAPTGEAPTGEAPTGEAPTPEQSTDAQGQIDQAMTSGASPEDLFGENGMLAQIFAALQQQGIDPMQVLEAGIKDVTGQDAGAPAPEPEDTEDAGAPEPEDTEDAGAPEPEDTEEE